MRLQDIGIHLMQLLLFAPFMPAAWTGKVTGTVRIENTRVLTTGAKSDKDLVVYLEPQVPGAYPVPNRHVEMDQRGLVFIPHVMAVRKGTPVDFLNNDNDRHNVYFLFEKTGATLDIGTWGPGQAVSYTFDDTGVVIALCQLHLEMAAYILVFDHPFFSVVEIDPQTQSARFEIDRVPPGQYALKVWHKKLKLKGNSLEIKIANGVEIKSDLVITKSKYAK